MFHFFAPCDPCCKTWFLRTILGRLLKIFMKSSSSISSPSTRLNLLLLLLVDLRMRRWGLGKCCRRFEVDVDDSFPVKDLFMDKIEFIDWNVGKHINQVWQFLQWIPRKKKYFKNIVTNTLFKIHYFIVEEFWSQQSGCIYSLFSMFFFKKTYFSNALWDLKQISYHKTYVRILNPLTSCQHWPALKYHIYKKKT